MPNGNGHIDPVAAELYSKLNSFYGDQLNMTLEEFSDRLQDDKARQSILSSLRWADPESFGTVTVEQFESMIRPSNGTQSLPVVDGDAGGAPLESRTVKIEGGNKIIFDWDRGRVDIEPVAPQEPTVPVSVEPKTGIVKGSNAEERMSFLDKVQAAALGSVSSIVSRRVGASVKFMTQDEADFDTSVRASVVNQLVLDDSGDRTVDELYLSFLEQTGSNESASYFRDRRESGLEDDEDRFTLQATALEDMQSTLLLELSRLERTLPQSRVEEINELVGKASQGDEEAMQALLQIREGSPVEGSYVNSIISLSRLSQEFVRFESEFADIIEERKQRGLQQKAIEGIFPVIAAVNPMHGIAVPIVRAGMNFFGNLFSFPGIIAGIIAPGKANLFTELHEKASRALNPDRYPLVLGIPSSYNRRIVDRVADVGGYEVSVGSDDKVLGVYRDGRPVEPEIAKAVAETYTSNPDSFESETSLNGHAALNTFIKGGVDIGLSMLLGSGVTRATGLAPRMSTMGVITARHMNDNYQSAVAELGQQYRGTALRYAFTTSLVQSAIDMANPIEARGITKFNSTSASTLRAASRRLSGVLGKRRALANLEMTTLSKLLDIGKSVGLEGAEGVFQQVSDNAIRTITNSRLQGVTSLDIASGMNEYANAFVSEAIGGLFGSAVLSKSPSALHLEAFEYAYENRDALLPFMAERNPEAAKRLGEVLDTVDKIVSIDPKGFSSRGVKGFIASAVNKALSNEESIKEEGEAELQYVKENKDLPPGVKDALSPPDDEVVIENVEAAESLRHRALKPSVGDTIVMPGRGKYKVVSVEGSDSAEAKVMLQYEGGPSVSRFSMTMSEYQRSVNEAVDGLIMDKFGVEGMERARQISPVVADAIAAESGDFAAGIADEIESAEEASEQSVNLPPSARLDGLDTATNVSGLSEEEVEQGDDLVKEAVKIQSIMGSFGVEVFIHENLDAFLSKNGLEKLEGARAVTIGNTIHLSRNATAGDIAQEASDVVLSTAMSSEDGRQFVKMLFADIKGKGFFDADAVFDAYKSVGYSDDEAMREVVSEYVAQVQEGKIKPSKTQVSLLGRFTRFVKEKLSGEEIRLSEVENADDFANVLGNALSRGTRPIARFIGVDKEGDGGGGGGGVDSGGEPPFRKSVRSLRPGVRHSAEDLDLYLLPEEQMDDGQRVLSEDIRQSAERFEKTMSEVADVLDIGDKVQIKRTFTESGRVQSLIEVDDDVSQDKIAIMSTIGTLVSPDWHGSVFSVVEDESSNLKARTFGLNQGGGNAAKVRFMNAAIESLFRAERAAAKKANREPGTIVKAYSTDAGFVIITRGMLLSDSEIDSVIAGAIKESDKSAQLSESSSVRNVSLIESRTGVDLVRDASTDLEGGMKELFDWAYKYANKLIKGVGNLTNLDRSVEVAIALAHKYEGVMDDDVLAETIARVTLGGNKRIASAVVNSVKNSNAFAKSIFNFFGKDSLIAKAYRRFLKSKGNLPEVVRWLDDLRLGSRGEVMMRAAALAEKLEKAIQKTGASRDDVNLLLEGVPDASLLARLPAEVKSVVFAMRDLLDSISLSLLDRGYASRMSSESIANKVGKYLNRSFGIYHGKKLEGVRAWLNDVVSRTDDTNQYRFDNLPDNLQEELVETMIALHGSRYMRMLEQERGEEGFADEELQDFMRKRAVFESKLILNKAIDKEPAPVPLSYFSQKRNTSILKHRKNIPQAFRKAFGEYTDPTLRFMLTAAKGSQLFFNSHFLSSFKLAGIGRFLFNPRSTNPPPEGFEFVISSEGSPAMRPLSGLTTNREIAQALRSHMRATDEMIAREDVMFYLLNKANFGLNWLNTVGNYVTQSRNFFGNVGFMMANAYFSPSAIGQASRLLANKNGWFFAKKFGSEGEPVSAAEKVIAAMKDLNLIGQSVVIETLKDIQGLGSWENVMRSYVEAQRLRSQLGIGMKDALRFVHKSMRLPSKAVEAMNKLYEAGDDFFKIMSFVIEAQRYSKVLFGKSYGELSEEELDVVHVTAGEIAKNVLPNYSRIGDVGRTLARTALIGSFTTFQFEALRTSFNTAALALREVSSSNPVQRSIGAQRLLGMAAYMGGRSAVMYMQIKLLGLGLTGLGGLLFGSEEERRYWEALRRSSPPWIQDNTLIPVRKGDNGKVWVIDGNSIDPFGLIDRSLNIVINEPIETKLKRLVVNFGRTFLGSTILGSMLWDIVRNEERNSGSIYLSTDSFGDKLLKSTLYLVENASGSIKSIDRILKDEAPWTRLASQMVGLNIYEIDPVLKFRIELGKALNSQNGYLIEVIRDYRRGAKKGIRKGIHPDELRNHYQQSLARFNELAYNMRRVYIDAVVMGADPAVMQDLMEELRIANKYRLFITGETDKVIFNEVDFE